MNELTDRETAHLWDKYSTVLLEHSEVSRIRRRVLYHTATAVLFLALAFLLWRVW